MAEIADALGVNASTAANTSVSATHILYECRLLKALNDITRLRESGLLEVSLPAE